MELIAKANKSFIQTEVGLLPEDWEVIKIGDVLEFKNGLNKAKEFFGQGTPIINYMDTFSHPGLKQEVIQGKVTLSKSEIRRFNVQKGDVFFTRTSETVNEIGISSVLEEEIKDGVFSGFILRGRPKNDRLSIGFKRYCFSSNVVRKQIISMATYTTRALTNGRQLSKVNLPVPKNENEQQAIATALSDVDELIRSLDVLIQKKEAIKKGTMQQLLTGKKRLSGFDGEWEVKALGDLGQAVIGLTYNSEDVQSHGTLVLRSSNIQNSQLAFDDNVYVSSKVSPEKYVQEGDILICARNGSARLIGKCAYIDKKAEGSAFGAFMAVLRSNMGKYLYYAFQSDMIQQQINEHLGATINQITNKSLRSFEIPIPTDRKEQQAIAQFLTNMDEELKALRRKREKMARVKEGMMQELLTGKTRLIK